MAKTRYGESFFQYVDENARRSGKEVVPIILDIVKPRSVVDVGCGIGTWLSVFKENGIDDITGLDGTYVRKERLKIPEANFIATDLMKDFPTQREFDLVVSLEVAEHLHENRASSFVQALTRLGKVILFSAAIPNQGGDGHINEQWPEYWAALFEQENYIPVDCIRGRIWNNPNVARWYAQNILVFVARNHLEQVPELKKAFDQQSPFPLALVHPQTWERHHRKCQSTLPELIKTRIKKWLTAMDPPSRV